MTVISASAQPSDARNAKVAVAADGPPGVIRACGVGVNVQVPL